MLLYLCAIWKCSEKRTVHEGLLSVQVQLLWDHLCGHYPVINEPVHIVLKGAIALHNTPAALESVV